MDAANASCDTETLRPEVTTMESVLKSVENTDDETRRYNGEDADAAAAASSEKNGLVEKCAIYAPIRGRITNARLDENGMKEEAGNDCGAKIEAVSENDDSDDDDNKSSSNDDDDDDNNNSSRDKSGDSPLARKLDSAQDTPNK